MKFMHCFTFVLILGLFVLPSEAATRRWIAGSGYWSNPNNWSPTKYASIIEAQKEAAKSAAGVYERTTISHEAYPKYFLDKFESKLI